MHVGNENETWSKKKYIFVIQNRLSYVKCHCLVTNVQVYQLTCRNATFIVSQNEQGEANTCFTFRTCDGWKTIKITYLPRHLYSFMFYRCLESQCIVFSNIHTHRIGYCKCHTKPALNRTHLNMFETLFPICMA